MICQVCKKGVLVIISREASKCKCCGSIINMAEALGDESFNYLEGHTIQGKTQ